MEKYYKDVMRENNELREKIRILEMENFRLTEKIKKLETDKNKSNNFLSEMNEILTNIKE